MAHAQETREGRLTHVELATSFVKSPLFPCAEPPMNNGFRISPPGHLGMKKLRCHLQRTEARQLNVLLL